MYLLPYIACVMVWVVALVYAIYRKQTTSNRTTGGLVARAMLSLLLAAFVGALWHYTGDKYLQNETIHNWVKIISVVFFLCAMPEVWLEDKTGDG